MLYRLSHRCYPVKKLLLSCVASFLSLLLTIVKVLSYFADFY